MNSTGHGLPDFSLKEAQGSKGKVGFIRRHFRGGAGEDAVFTQYQLHRHGIREGEFTHQSGDLMKSIFSLSQNAEGKVDFGG
jgi:hypothetical protein